MDSGLQLHLSVKNNSEEPISLKEFCQILPKAELHAHLNGSLSEETLKLLGVPQNQLKGYQIINNVTKNPKDKLNECFKLFRVAHSATKTPESVYTATKHTIREYYEDNVFYLELRTTPRKEDHMTKKEYIESAVQAIKDNEKAMMVKLILSIDRSHDQKTSEAAMDLIIEMYKLFPDIIKGVDLCANPNVGTFNEAIFTKARENGLKVTLHCGEIKNDEEVLRMLRFKPDRIGHATCLHPDYGGSKEIWELFSTLKIPTECCLTSNVMCGTSQGYEKHQAVEWIKQGLPFSLNTDDKGVFSTTLSKEYFYAVQDLKLPKQSLVNCVLETLKHSFASDEEKAQLSTAFCQWTEQHRAFLS